MMSTEVFRLDPTHGRLMGVCAGLARRTGLDVTLIRVVVVVATLFSFGVVGVAAYLLAGWLAPR